MIARADVARQEPRDLGQDLVAHGVTVRVVDRLESVEIDKKE